MLRERTLFLSPSREEEGRKEEVGESRGRKRRRRLGRRIIFGATLAESDLARDVNFGYWQTENRDSLKNREESQATFAPGLGR